MKYYINDELKATVTAAGKAANAEVVVYLNADANGLNMNLESVGDVVLPDNTPEDDSHYKKVTFKHFGLNDGTYQGVQKGTADLMSMNEVAIVGTITFLQDKQDVRFVATNSEGYMSIATISIWNSVLQVTDHVHSNQTQLKKYEIGTALNLRITFKYSDTNIIVRYYIDGELMATHTVKDVTDKIIPTMLVKPDGKGIKITSDADVAGDIVLPDIPGQVIVPDGTITQQTPEELGYKEITLSSFGLDNQAVYGNLNGKQEHTTLSYVRPSLSGTYLNMNVTFKAKDSANSIRYAGSDGYHGIMIYPDNGVLKFVNAKYLTGLSFKPEEIGLQSVNETFNLKLAVQMGTFSVKSGTSQCDEVKVCIWINDKLVAKDVIFRDLVKAGNRMGFDTNGAKEGRIEIQVPAGAYTGIDFAIWGYTKDWKKAMGL